MATLDAVMAHGAVLHGSVGRAHSPLPRSGSCEALVHGYAKPLKIQPIPKSAICPKPLILPDSRHIHATTPRAVAGYRPADGLQTRHGGRQNLGACQTSCRA